MAATEAETSKRIEQILQQPYTHVLTPDPNGGFAAEILEFPGCFSQGETAEDAHANLVEAARSWLAAAFDSIGEIPPPLAPSQARGAVRLVLPKTMHGRALLLAAREGVPVETFLLAIIAEAIGDRAAKTEASSELTLDPIDFSKVLDLLEAAPRAFRELLRPVVLKAMTSPELAPFVRLLLTDRHLQHLLLGREPTPFF